MAGSRAPPEAPDGRGGGETGSRGWPEGAACSRGWLAVTLVIRAGPSGRGELADRSGL